MLINHSFINLDRFEAEENKASVIITHGMAEHSGRFKDIALKLVEAGFNVITYDLRGHGKSQGRRGSIKSYKLFVEDLNVIVKNERKNNEKIFLIGHSMGGLINTLYYLEYGQASGAIIIASPLDYVIKPTFINKISLKLFGFKKMKTNFADEKLSHHAHNLNDPLNLKYFKVDLVYQILIKGLYKIINNYGSIQLPVLMLYGEEDKIVSLETAKTAFKKIGSKDKTLITYKKSKHDLLHDIESEKVISDILNWLEKQILEGA